MAVLDSHTLQHKIKPSDLSQLISDGSVAVVDVRTTSEFRSGHIAGSISVPMDEIESRLADIPKGKHIVLVCQSGRRAEITREQVKSQLNAVCLDGGVAAWEQEGLPTVHAVRTRLALDRQSMIGASVLILLSVLLGTTVSVGWYFLALLPGIGLMTAGTTGFCLMGTILSVMPWNRARG